MAIQSNSSITSLAYVQTGLGYFLKKIEHLRSVCKWARLGIQICNELPFLEF